MNRKNTSPLTASPTPTAGAEPSSIPPTSISISTSISAMLPMLPQVFVACGLMAWGAINFFSNRESIGQVLGIFTSDQAVDFRIGILALLMFLLIAFLPFVLGMGLLYRTLVKISGPNAATADKNRKSVTD